MPQRYVVSSESAPKFDMKEHFTDTARQFKVRLSRKTFQFQSDKNTLIKTRYAEFFCARSHAFYIFF